MRARVVTFALLAALFALVGCGGKGEHVNQSDRDRAVDKAQAAYRQASVSGRSLSEGPCIAEELPGLPDWVSDIVHDPREPADDEPSNQCERYLSGQAHHFVELDEDGSLIRAE